MCEHNRFCMRKWLRNVAGVILHQFSAPGVAKMTYFYVFWYFLHVLHVLNVFICISSKTIYFAHFEAPGILKTAPACIFHHS